MRVRLWRNGLILACVGIGVIPTRAALAGAEEAAVLRGRAVLPAATFAQGPTSGRLLAKEPIHGQAVPFADRQPVQGLSALVPEADGRLLALADNGFGKLTNSADFLLRLYRIRPLLRTAAGTGAGTIEVMDHVSLADPDRKIPFPIVNEFTSDRLLTGADFDVESLQRGADGTLWLGDEFGPFLLHFAPDGKLLEAPIALPDLDNPGRELRSPENPYARANLMLRALEAFRAHAWRHGAGRSPVYSPSALLLGRFRMENIRAAGFPMVVWTVNNKAAILELMKRGVDGVISDRPDLLRQAVIEFDADGDGKGGDFLDSAGLLVGDRFDAQGHRGGRDLRPESTLPAMEVALDELVSTLELDTGITADGVPLVGHDSELASYAMRRADGSEYTKEDELLVKDVELARIQREFVADKLLSGRPEQKNDLAQSPVSVAFVANAALPSPYTPPSLDQVFAFVDFYADYYETGAGKDSRDAARRAANARRVRFNIETKTDPAPPGKSKTVRPEPFAVAVASAIAARGLEARADIQSFDPRTLLVVQAKYPAIRTVYLFEPTNFDAALGLVSLPVPPNERDDPRPPRVPTTGGLEAMALSPDGRYLYPMLEKPLADTADRRLTILKFDVERRAFTQDRYYYPLEPWGVSVADFVLMSDRAGVVLERDDTEGELNGKKGVFEITLGEPGEAVAKRLALDLMNVNDPGGITTPVGGDVGLGRRFSFPFHTIESLVVYDARHLGVLNDNNFPFSVGRHVGSGAPDDSEYILVELSQPLGGAAGVTNRVPLPRPAEGRQALP